MGRTGLKVSILGIDVFFMHHVQTMDELDRILAPDGALRAAEAARDIGCDRRCASGS